MSGKPESLRETAGAVTPTPTPQTSGDRLVGVSAALAAVFTVAVIVTPWTRFAYDNLSLHVALETAEGLVGALLAYLAFGRFRSTRHAWDLALTVAFTVLAGTNLLLSAVPVIALEARPVGFATWASAALRLLGAAGLVVAAVGSARPVPMLRARSVVPWVVLGLVVVAAVAGAAEAWLSDAIDPELSPSSSRRPRAGHLAVHGVQVAGLLLYAGAAVGFHRRLRRTNDDLLRWLTTGALLAAFARLHYFLFPSLYSNWVYTGDVLRLASYAAFLGGAAREIRAYWTAQASALVAEERARLARDLHDGLMQEISFIRSQTSSPGRTLEGDQLAHVAAAADRALVESRDAVRALAGEDDDASVDVLEAIRQAAEQVATRAGASVAVRGDDETRVASLSGPVREAVLRIVREAVTNSVRHGAASAVTIGVEVDGSGVLRVTVSDDGRGFDQAAAKQGFGLRSMADRAAGAGGNLAVRSTPSRGTTVEATFSIRPR